MSLSIFLVFLIIQSTWFQQRDCFNKITALMWIYMPDLDIVYLF